MAAVTAKGLLRNIWISQRCDNISGGIIDTDYLLFAIDETDREIDKMTEEEAAELL